MPVESFLTEFAQDTLTIVGACGFVLTAIGVWLAWLQMRRTTSAAEAASQTAVAALTESRDQYNRYIITHSSRLLTETRVYIKNESWYAAAMRLGDLADLLLQVAGNEPVWSELAGRLQTMEKSFDRIHRNESTFSESLKGKWHKLDRELRTQIEVSFHSPQSEPDYVSAELITRGERVYAIRAEDGYPNFDRIRPLYEDAFRRVTGWDSAMQQIEDELSGNDEIGTPF